MKIKTNMLCITLAAALAASVFSACNKDEMNPPTISFKTGAGYTAKDTIAAGGAAILIGINAAKSGDASESKDVLSHFNISKSVNGGTAASVYDEDMSSSNEDNYSHDFNTTVSATAGESDKYTFTITNRDGLTAQIHLTVTSK